MSLGDHALVSFLVWQHKSPTPYHLNCLNLHYLSVADGAGNLSFSGFQVGTYAVLSSQGALVEAKTSPETQRELAALLQVPVVAGTVNR